MAEVIDLYIAMVHVISSCNHTCYYRRHVPFLHGQAAGFPVTYPAVIKLPYRALPFLPLINVCFRQPRVHLSHSDVTNVEKYDLGSLITNQRVPLNSVDT